MTSRLLISLSLLLAAPMVWAETAEEIFNGGAQLYISNNIPVALEKVESGRKLYPEDEKLKKLEELLKQQQQSQSQQNQQNQQNQQQQNQQQNQKDSQNQKQDQKQDQSQSGQKQDQKQQSKPQGKNGEKKDEKQDQEAKAGQMTPRDAKRLLDSEKNDEQFLVPHPDGKPPKDGKVVKDW
ncbi:MAG TPA: hypothetical protein VN625_05670 [Desulfuromonadaceae bacterium]|nr:hypothetical protein [Desulfuromonadaceae bacterium]